MGKPDEKITENPGTGNRKNKKKLIFTLLAIVVGIIVFARLTGNIHNAIFRKKAMKEKTAALKFEEEATPVKAFKVHRTELKDTLPAIGNVKGFKEIDLKFQVAGVIESFNFEEGEKIQEGDIIASLVQKEALIKLKYAETELNKDQKLFDIGAINSIKLEQGKLEYESAKTELDKTNIYAMSNGLLGSRLIDTGSYVTPNDRVGIFVDIDKVYAEFNIIERDVPKVALGQKAEVFIDAYPTKVFNGSVDRMSPIIEGRSRTENIKIELDNKEGLLKPGMFVRASIATYDKKDVLVIPLSALKKKENDYVAYVIHKEEIKGADDPTKAKAKEKKGFWIFGKAKVKEEAKPPIEKAPEYGTIEVKPVKIGYMTQDLVQVDEGLSEDALIVTEIQEEFKDKAKVEVSEVQEGLI
ncbi:MAG: efflux RND transporter periplasmic adaptor subunit [Candidatus Omnitrophica bacterium]|nr:efflux RND transporter periplasmic adaptor subunit [Candidatus Omnitrophota bacterium]